MTDAFASALSGQKRALSQRAMEREVAKIDRRSNDRMKRIAKAQNAYRHRWSQLSDEEIVDLVEQRRRTRAHDPMPPSDRRSSDSMLPRQ